MHIQKINKKITHKQNAGILQYYKRDNRKEKEKFYYLTIFAVNTREGKKNNATLLHINITWQTILFLDSLYKIHIKKFVMKYAQNKQKIP